MDLQRSARITNITLLGVALSLTLMTSTIARAEQVSYEKLSRTSRQVEVLVRSTARRMLPPRAVESRMTLGPVMEIRQDLHHETLCLEDRLVYASPPLPQMIALPPPSC